MLLVPNFDGRSQYPHAVMEQGFALFLCISVFCIMTSIAKNDAQEAETTLFTPRNVLSHQCRQVDVRNVYPYLLVVHVMEMIEFYCCWSSVPYHIPIQAPVFEFSARGIVVVETNWRVMLYFRNL